MRVLQITVTEVGLQSGVMRMKKTSFEDSELALFEVAKKVLLDRQHTLDVLQKPAYYNIGMEGWFQTELIVALNDEKYNVVMKGKVARGCDLMAEKGDEGNSIGVELRTAATANYKYLETAFQQHPRADLYLFLAKYNEVKFDKLIKTWTAMGYIKAHRVVDGWVVMIVKRQGTS